MKEVMKKRVFLPGWVFVAIMAVFCELILHFWTSETILPGRVVGIAVFGLALGALLGFITSLFGAKWQKWSAVALSFMLVALYLTEYFMIDAYKVFMSLETMFSRAGDVAGSFMDMVIGLLKQNVLRIFLMLLPVILYAVFARTEKSGWKLKGALALAAVLLYALGVGVVNWVGLDAGRFSETYSFDAAVRCLGLNVSIALESTRGSAEDEFNFSTLDTLPTVSESEETNPSQEATDPEEPTEPPVVYGTHEFDLDYGALADTAGNNNIAMLHRYVASQKPQSENQYTGMFEGMNLIFITAEAFSAEVIDPVMTPILYRLATQGIQFTDYYQPAWGGSTTTGEFSNLIGLVPINGGGSMWEVVDHDMFLMMGKQLQKQGYTTMGYHNHSFTYYSRQNTHSHLGLEKFIGMGNGMEQGVVAQSPESDLEMFNFTIPQHLDDEPFYLYYMTMSGHATYYWDYHAMARKHREEVAHLDYSEKVKCYLAANLELEAGLASMIQQLDEAGILENTVIVLATDHYPYGLEKSDTWGNTRDYLAELYGQPVTDCFVRDHSALIIWTPSIEDMDIVVDEPVYSLDILPTLSNLFGVEYDSRLLIGRDVLSDAEPVILWPNYSWKTDKGSFDATTYTFTPNEGVEVEEGYVDRINALVRDKIEFSRRVQNYDYYDVILEALNNQNGEE